MEIPLELPIPERDGYRFTGWYTGVSSGKKYTEDTQIYGDVTLYARWKVKSTYSNSSGGGGGGGSSSSKTSGGTTAIGGPGAGSFGTAVSGSWNRIVGADGQVRWTFQTDNNETPKDTWTYIANSNSDAGLGGPGESDASWFRFDEEGYMITGWFSDTDKHIYYLNPAMGDSQGRMLTGWQQIDGKWYFFRDWAGGPYGSMMVNDKTPDGYLLDEKGVWNGMPAK